MNDWNELKRLAEEAFGWEWSSEGGEVFAFAGEEEHIAHCYEGYGNAQDTAAFISAANPSIVLALIAENDHLQAELATPDEITADPVADYDGLRKQFLALRTICNSKARQVEHWRRQSGDDVRQAMVETAANVNGERETNSMLTDALESAEAERDQLKTENASINKKYIECYGILKSSFKLSDEFHEHRDQLQAELDECARALPGPYCMDPPDGGDVPIGEQISRMAKDAERYRYLRKAGLALEGHDFISYDEIADYRIDVSMGKDI